MVLKRQSLVKTKPDNNIFCNFSKNVAELLSLKISEVKAVHKLPKAACLWLGAHSYLKLNKHLHCLQT